MDKIKELLSSDRTAYKAVSIYERTQLALDEIQKMIERNTGKKAGRSQVVEYLVRYYISKKELTDEKMS